MEIAILLAKDATEPVSMAEVKIGFYNLCFIMPQKSLRFTNKSWT